MIFSLAFSQPASAARSSSAVPLDVISGSSPGSYVSHHTIYYAGAVTCTGKVARINDTFTVQILVGSTWTRKDSKSNSCEDCSSLYSPNSYSNYSYTGSAGQHVRVIEVYSATFYGGDSEGESATLGPYVFGA